MLHPLNFDTLNFDKSVKLLKQFMSTFWMEFTRAMHRNGKIDLIQLT